MLYFIPAWYHENEWKELEQLWYRRRMHSETDDTVKQIQLFQRNRIRDYRILLLSFAPNLRHFLHRQSVFHAPYWSCFDAIQEVKRRKPAVFSFHNLNWPANTEFLYSSFAVVAMLDGKKYAQIEFGEDGNTIQVDLYHQEELSRRNIYDDRGFVSCTIVYENGRMAYEQYLTENGVWKICRFADGHVVVNPESACFVLETEKGERRIPFSGQSYPSMGEVIGEVTGAWLGETEETDIFCAALHPQHMALLGKLMNGRKTIFSTFGDRMLLRNNELMRWPLEAAGCIITDSEKNHEILSQEMGRGRGRLVNIPPYDTRMDFGISQQLHVQKILLVVDRLGEELFREVTGHLASYLEKNHNARVHLFTRNAEYDREDVLLGRVREILAEKGFPQEWARKENDNKFEFLLEEEEQIPILFRVEQCVDELSVNKCLREQRILLDLSDSPDLFLQITSVGMGLPQIVRAQTQYIRPGKNGRINKEPAALEEDIAFYLENLSNWNQAMIFSYELGKEHSTESLIRQWKEVIEEIEHSESVAAGKRRLQ